MAIFEKHKFKNIGISKEAPYGLNWRTGKPLKKKSAVTIRAFNLEKTFDY